MLASDLHLRLTYAWLPQRRGFVRNTVGEGLCDVFIGVPDGFERLLLTRPYYRSSYVSVQRAADPPLEVLRTACAVAAPHRRATDRRRPRGDAARLRARACGRDRQRDRLYRLRRRSRKRAHGERHRGGPHRRRTRLGAAACLFRDSRRCAADGRTGPPAGWLGAPFEFSVAVGANRAKPALRDELQAALDRRHAEIDAILADYNCGSRGRAARGVVGRRVRDDSRPLSSTEMPRALWLIAPAVIASVASLAGCEREQRQLHTPPPAASAASAVTMGSIQPVASAVTTSSTQPVAAAVSYRSVSNPYENNAYAVSQGKRLFRAYNCSGCHAQGSGDSGPALMDDKWIYGADPASVFTTIKQGRPNGMPAFGGHVSDDRRSGKSWPTSVR